MLLHVFEHFLHSVKHDAGILLIAEHRVSFAGTGRAIGEYCGIVAIQDTLAEELGGVLEDLELWAGLVEGVIKGVLLLL